MVKKPLRQLTIPRCLACFLLFLLAIAALKTGAQSLPSKNYSTSDGLAHDRVNKIDRDSRGFLWFSTGEGLSRFDGYEFKSYTQAHGLPHRTVNDILEVVNDTYLVATDAGLAVFDAKGKVGQPERPMFRVFGVPHQTSDNRPLSVNVLYRANSGQVWAGTSVGLYRLVPDGENWRFELIDGEEWKGSNAEVFSIAEDRFARIWLTASTGLFIFDPEANRSAKVRDFATGRSITSDNDGRIWVGGSIGTVAGLYCFTVPDVNSDPKVERRYTTADGLTDNVWFNSIFKSSDGRIYAGVRNGLGEFQPESPAGEPAFRTLLETDLVSVGEDSGGSLWIGTASHGAFKLTRGGFVLYQTEAKKPYSGLTSIFTGADDDVFVTSSYNELLRFTGEGFETIRIPALKNRSWGWGQLDLRSRFDGDWWIPSSAGLARFSAVNDPRELAQNRPSRTYTSQDGLFADPVFHVFEDSRGDIWLSVISEVKDTVHRWDRDEDKIHGYTTADGLPEANAPTAFAEDAAGNVWIGFYSGGVARFRGGKFDVLSARTGFPTGLVNAIHNDRNGRIWIATSNSGVVRIDDPDQSEPSFVSISVKDGLSSNQANCITEDHLGRVYIGTARGINRLDPRTGRFKLYTRTDGLPGNSIGRCARDGRGNLWFSQNFALAKLVVGSDETDSPPPIFIADLRAGGVEVGGLSELGESTVEGLDLDPDQGKIDISFFALGFGTGETLRYQYKFTNDEWSEPSAQRTVNLSLAPGNYDFFVRAVNAEGIVSETPARVSFSIARPIWQRWWFLFAAALLFAAAFYTVYRYRLDQLLKLERVRTRIASDLHDDIGSSLSQIAILSEVARQKVGDSGANEPLNMIANTSREMVDSMSDIVWAINPQKDRLSDLIQRMRRFAEDMFDSKNIAYRFTLPAEAHDISLSADVRREVYLIFKECINNLVKHSGADEAHITIKVNRRFLTVEVNDNGSGFDPKSAYDDETESVGGFGGNGLPNMRRRAESSGGAFEIRAEPGKGTDVRFQLPVEMGHRKSRI